MSQETTNDTITTAIAGKMPEKVGEAALWYAKQGIYIFPCIGSGSDDWTTAKKPLTQHGFKDASNDIEQVTAWWSENPNAFIGIATGAVNNLTVIDVDSEEDKHFYPILLDYAKRLNCPMVSTSKGFHVYFADCIHLRSKTGIRPGIDVRAAGGYVIAPPSHHFPTRKSYKLIQGDMNQLPDFPDELLKLLMPDISIEYPTKERVSHDDMWNVIEVLEHVSADDYDTWYRVGMALKNDFGKEGYELWDDWSQQSAKYNPKEMQKKWASFSDKGKITCGTVFWLAKQHKKEPTSDTVLSDNEWPEPESIRAELLPVKTLSPEMLPSSIRAWVLDTAERMECPIDYIAAIALVALGSVIGSRCRIQPKQKDTQWQEVPNIWGGIVAYPGMKKSPAIAASLDFLNKLERQNHDTYEQHRLEYLAAMESYEVAMEAQKNGEGNANATIIKPVEPVQKRHIINDSTVEKLGVILSGNPQGVLAYDDELTGLLAKFELKEKATERAFYLKAWNGKDSHQVDRIGRESIFTPCVCVSVLGGIQPDKLSYFLNQAMQHHGNDGLLQRFQLLVYPDIKETGMVDRNPDMEAYWQTQSVFKGLAEADFAVLGASAGDTPIFRFSPEAQQLFNEWYISHKKLIASVAEDEPILAQHLAKYNKLMPALALIFHLINAVIDSNKRGSISVEATQQAIAWCEYLQSHARRIYAIGFVANRSIIRLAKLITDGKLPDTFTVRDIRRKEASGLKNSSLIMHALEELEALKWIKPVPKARGNAYVINPRQKEFITIN
jgi:hypothetical protein